MKLELLAVLCSLAASLKFEQNAAPRWGAVTQATVDVMPQGATEMTVYIEHATDGRRLTAKLDCSDSWLDWNEEAERSKITLVAMSGAKTYKLKANVKSCDSSVRYVQYSDWSPFWSYMGAYKENEDAHCQSQGYQFVPHPSGVTGEFLVRSAVRNKKNMPGKFLMVNTSQLKDVPSTDSDDYDAWMEATRMRLVKACSDTFVAEDSRHINITGINMSSEAWPQARDKEKEVAIDGKFSKPDEIIHSMTEDNPWLMVDLGETPKNIYDIYIHNRGEFAEFNRKLSGFRLYLSNSTLDELGGKDMNIEQFFTDSEVFASSHNKECSDTYEKQHMRLTLDGCKQTCYEQSDCTHFAYWETTKRCSTYTQCANLKDDSTGRGNVVYKLRRDFMTKSIDASGCADGTAEGLRDYADISACEGSWSVPGLKGPQSKKNSAASLCASGWSICSSVKQVVATGLTDLDCNALSGFFASSISYPPSEQRSQQGCLETDAKYDSTNDFHGCGNVAIPQNCGPLTKALGDKDENMKAYGFKNMTGHEETEMLSVIKDRDDKGGVLCCRDDAFSGSSVPPTLSAPTNMTLCYANTETPGDEIAAPCFGLASKVFMLVPGGSKVLHLREFTVRGACQDAGQAKL